MASTAETVASLRKKVKAAEEEFRSAIATHEVWKLAAYDSDLHERMGTSYATNAFLIVRNALRRETLMALMRLWDNNPKALSLHNIRNILRDGRVVDVLAAECAAQWDNSETRIIGLEDIPLERRVLVEQAARESGRSFGQEMANKLRENVQEILNLIEKYQENGSGYRIFDYLRLLRDQYFAHKQLNPTTVSALDNETSDEAVEQFYNDMAQVIHLLRLVAENVHYEPEQSAEIYRKYATLFWQSAKGEMTEGHPSYRRRRRPDTTGT